MFWMIGVHLLETIWTTFHYSWIFIQLLAIECNRWMNTSTCILHFFKTSFNMVVCKQPGFLVSGTILIMYDICSQKTCIGLAKLTGGGFFLHPIKLDTYNHSSQCSSMILTHTKQSNNQNIYGGTFFFKSVHLKMWIIISGIRIVCIVIYILESICIPIFQIMMCMSIIFNLLSM